MKAKLTLENGKTIDMELTREQEELINKNNKRTGYERLKEDDYYYFVSVVDVTNIMRTIEGNSPSDDRIYERANYYSDETLAKNIVRADTLMRKLRRFAVENGGSFSKEEWLSYNDINKYYIEFNYYNNELDIDDMVNYRYFGQIFFRSKEIAQEAIDIFKEDLLWYFTEFDDMLR